MTNPVTEDMKSHFAEFLELPMTKMAIEMIEQAREPEAQRHALLMLLEVAHGSGFTHGALLTVLQFISLKEKGKGADGP